MTTRPDKAEHAGEGTEIADLPTGPVEYRLTGGGESTVVVLHGGHMRAGLRLGEDVFAEGRSVLIPSRPGYGRTPLEVGASPAAFADVTARLCERLGLRRIEAVVGVSAGGPTAAALASRHPHLVRRVVLECAVGPLPWPDRRTRLVGRVVFAPGVETVTWTAVRALLRIAPATGLRTLLGGLSNRPPAEVFAALDDDRRAGLAEVHSRMRSGRGFRNDLRTCSGSVPSFEQPCLVVAARGDGAVPMAQALAWVRALPNAELLISDADSHLLWFDADYPLVADRIRRFLGAGA